MQSRVGKLKRLEGTDAERGIEGGVSRGLRKRMTKAGWSRLPSARRQSRPGMGQTTVSQ